MGAPMRAEAYGSLRDTWKEICLQQHAMRLIAGEILRRADKRDLGDRPLMKRSFLQEAPILGNTLRRSRRRSVFPQVQSIESSSRTVVLILRIAHLRPQASPRSL